MTRFIIAVASLIILSFAFSTPAHAQSGAQIPFVVPKPKLVILEAVQNGTIESLLLAVGLDKKLEESFPSNNPNSPREVTVRVFSKALGVPVYVFPMQVVRSANQTWAQALGATAPTGIGGPGGGGDGGGLIPYEPPTFPGFGDWTVCGGGPSYSIIEDFKTVIVCGHAPGRGD